MKMYKQCLLSRGNEKQVAWIEERGAKAGASVELKEDGLFWDVKEVFPHVMSEEVLRTKQKNDRDAFASIRGA